MKSSTHGSQTQQQVSRSRSCVLTALASIVAGTLPASALADTGTGSRLDSMLEEVIITARKREEGLQDAPLAVTAFTGDSLEARGISNIQDIGAITPNLTYVNNPQAGGASSVATVYIRGVGQRDFLGTIDNGVGFYIDGVYIARTIGATVDLVDVERVEVLRGPQGTLFGRNNVGGAIALYNRKPDGELGGRIEGTIGTDSLARLKLSLNTPLTDTLFANFAVLDSRQDGYVDRPAGGDLGDDNSTSYRGGLLWQPSDSLAIQLSGDYSQVEENGAAFTLVSAGAQAPGGFAAFYNNVTAAASCAYPGGLTSANPACYNDQWTSDDRNFGTAPNYSDTTVWGLALNVEWNISDDLSLKSITGYRDLDAEFARDADGSPLPVVHFFDDFATEQFSQELQLLGSALDGRLDWITGLYYFDEKGDNLNVLDFAIASFNSGSGFSTESKAVFVQGSYHLSEKLSLTLGMRYTEEEKTFDPVQIVVSSNIGIPPGTPILPLGEQAESWSESTPMFNLAYNFTGETMAYATYSEGFRSGGFVQRIFPPLSFVPSFDPEFVESYELGAKYQRADGNLALNLAAFFMDYTDIQVRTENPGFVGFFEANVGDAEISGFEFETRWRPYAGWFLETSLAYLHAEYTAIRVDPPLVAQVSLDSEFDFVPEWSASLSVAKEFNLGDRGFLVARLSGSYQSGYYNNPNNTDLVETPSTDLWNANLVWNSVDETYSVNFGVKNLGDDKFLSSGYNNIAIGTADVIYDRGRQWYLTGSYSF